jgi:RND family efflux transporter MFP subunit
MKNSTFPRAVLALFLPVLLLACSKPPPAEEPLRSVKLMTVAVSNIGAGPEFAGEVRARVESRLGFRVAGKLVRRQAEIGQRVRAGQVLAQLDPQDYKLASDAIRAQLQVAQTNRDLAEADFRRYKDLKEQNFVSGAELERRESALKATTAQVEQARAQLSVQGNQSAYTTLVADVAGTVTAVDAEVGQVVAAGVPVVRIAQDGPRDVVFAVAEDRVADVTLGSPVEVRRWSVGTRLNAKVREIAALADPVTRTYQVKASLDGLPPPLGSTVSVAPQSLSARGQPAMKLPTSALKQDGKGSAVWVYDPGTQTVRSQAVELVAADGNEVIVASGLAPGMQVVVAGVHVLSPGQKVTVYVPRSAPTVDVAGNKAAGAAAAGASSPPAK